jgi:hypothetical protein
MVDAVEVAIESALLDRLNALVFSPAIPISLPNVTLNPPVPGPNVAWLRATFLPATTVELEVAFDGINQHYGMFQVDVFYGLGTGELNPARIAATIIEQFKRGTVLVKGDCSVTITRPPYRKSMLRTDPWQMIPVCIPYLTYATTPN